MQRFNWSEEAVADLRRMVDEKRPYSDIARALSAKYTPIDSDAISGKVNRLGIGQGHYRRIRTSPGGVFNGDRALPSEPPPEGFQYVFQGAAGQRELKGLVPIVQEVSIDDGVSIYDLRETHCRWPLWKDYTKPLVPMYCGADVDPTETYCKAHARRAYDERAPRPKTSDATRQAQRIGQLRRWHKTGAAS